MRILVVGWSSVLHGEATAGDVLAMAAVSERLAAEKLAHDVAWSRIMCPPGGDLAALVPTKRLPVAAIYLTQGQHEYAGRRRHAAVTELLEHWLCSVDAARLTLDTRLDPRDWRLAHPPSQAAAMIARVDIVVTMRMHALVLGLRLVRRSSRSTRSPVAAR